MQPRERAAAFAIAVTIIVFCGSVIVVAVLLYFGAGGRP